MSMQEGLREKKTRKVLPLLRMARHSRSPLRSCVFAVAQAEESAKKPKIFFPHRLTWLFGGVSAGKKPKTLWTIGPDVAVYISEPFDLDDPHNGQLSAGDKWYNDDKSCFAFGPEHPLRTSLRTLAENVVFDTTVLAAICLGTVLLALEGPPGSLPAETLYLFDRIGDVLFLVFLVEFGAKVVGYGFVLTPESYLKNPWNRLDFVVIVGSIINYLGGNAGASPACCWWCRHLLITFETTASPLQDSSGCCGACVRCGSSTATMA